ncbi:hypothetical protein HMPREF9454_02311 [Megamonas funiformis YIT 11815]|mgnify:FL=1|uniref:HTH cro/C1-type domain-containing protein n=1 Tax=Megamonas funiformis YIT 11815 TaxID=742816 RepID=A0ABP2NGX1_9FIRM|nr:DNA methyltransferase [Megamonas funiformis]EHR32750.1 hypothetical protein HMPREF9454_02311 [Megamonas funiformis YIT 11815]
MIRKKLGQRIKEKRLQLGLSQEKFALSINMDRTYFASIEKRINILFKLINDDCFNLMKTIPDNCIDLILTDPPYNIAQYSTGNIFLPKRKPINNDIANWDKNSINPHNLVYDFKRILKPTGNIFIFTGYNKLGQWHEAFDKEFDTFQIFIWHKTNPPPKIYKNGFLNSCELIVCLWNKGHTWNFSTQKEMHNFFEVPILRD